MIGKLRFLAEGIALTIGAMAAILGLYMALVAGGALLRTAGDGLPHTRLIHIYSTPVHAEIILPMADDVADWRHLASAGGLRGTPAENEALAANATHVSIGWGAESFYRNVHQLSDIGLDDVLDGIWDDSLLHVSFLNKPDVIPGVMAIGLSEPGYRNLVAAVEAEFVRKNGKVVAAPGESYGTNDAFFDAVDSYSPLETCNEWVGDMLEVAGVVVGRFTPFSKTLIFSISVGDRVGDELGN
ncbi:DUF2459 domain-containing protein [Acuticoccus sp. MNP-M23]|uniref:DUF2459 domain-containing protein n=1 Tax=Acuticoccus sp. MNP-M23 TaxID=3072793 RepID=UPI00281581FF|nr:DUF2459 domain-containing protein [Acuticoccus sp. MNP-M23]WMS42869.1 DUF2459 domain-containing protein [Acuticoccus sp. MNP-M23]